MSTMEQVEENIRACSDDIALKADEQLIIDDQLERLKRAADLYCTGCKYCMPCPSGVDIPRVFDIYNAGRVFGLQNDARKNYERWAAKQANSKVATACVECGKCEELCHSTSP